jgi:hypothetical protein
MEKQIIKQLVEATLEAALSENVEPIKTNSSYCWQEFSVADEETEAELKEIGTEVKGTIYESGTVQLSVTISPSGDTDAVKSAFKRLKGKNLVKIADEYLDTAKRSKTEAYDLVKEAAALLGISEDNAKAMLKNQNEEAQL